MDSELLPPVKKPRLITNNNDDDVDDDDDDESISSENISDNNNDACSSSSSSPVSELNTLLDQLENEERNTIISRFQSLAKRKRTSIINALSSLVRDTETEQKTSSKAAADAVNALDNDGDDEEEAKWFDDFMVETEQRQQQQWQQQEEQQPVSILSMTTNIVKELSTLTTTQQDWWNSDSVMNMVVNANALEEDQSTKKWMACIHKGVLWSSLMKGYDTAEPKPQENWDTFCTRHNISRRQICRYIRAADMFVSFPTVYYCGFSMNDFESSYKELAEKIVHTQSVHDFWGYNPNAVAMTPRTWRYKSSSLPDSANIESIQRAIAYVQQQPNKNIQSDSS